MIVNRAYGFEFITADADEFARIVDRRLLDSLIREAMIDHDENPVLQECGALGQVPFARHPLASAVMTAFGGRWV